MREGVHIQRWRQEWVRAQCRPSLLTTPHTAFIIAATFPRPLHPYLLSYMSSPSPLIPSVPSPRMLLTSTFTPSLLCSFLLSIFPLLYTPPQVYSPLPRIPVYIFFLYLDSPSTPHVHTPFLPTRVCPNPHPLPTHVQCSHLRACMPILRPRYCHLAGDNASHPLQCLSLRRLRLPHTYTFARYLCCRRRCGERRESRCASLRSSLVMTSSTRSSPLPQPSHLLIAIPSPLHMPTPTLSRVDSGGRRRRPCHPHRRKEAACVVGISRSRRRPPRPRRAASLPRRIPHRPPPSLYAQPPFIPRFPPPPPLRYELPLRIPI
ncbi:hypothetical protein R3P38DRAFT_1317683 [Favolaschia claudopus]|uniref:Uncharacterized protein n=1 Tax=Favolaschia claudopus TaxID=2862362 RepID=A0AAW0AVX5_9AGAR